MRKTINQDGSTSYTLTQTEKTVLTALVAYLWGRRVGYYRGREAATFEIEKNTGPQL